jgi:hypothetical protein
MWIGWPVLRLKKKKDLAILMHDQSRRSSLYRSLNCEDVITQQSWQLSSWPPPRWNLYLDLTAPPSNFTPTLASNSPKGRTSHKVYFNHMHEGQKISVLRIFKSRPNFGFVSQMISSALAISFESLVEISSPKYQT